MLLGSRMSLIQPGVIVWEDIDDDWDSDRILAGGLITTITDIDGTATATCVWNGSRDDRDRHRAGISVRHLPLTRIHWCDQPGCFMCPRTDQSGAAVLIARRLMRAASDGPARFTPTEQDTIRLALTIHRITTGI